MTIKELNTRNQVGMSLRNILDRIDLAVYHTQKVEVYEDVDDDVNQLMLAKETIKKVLNKGYDLCAISRKQKI